MRFHGAVLKEYGVVVAGAGYHRLQHGRRLVCRRAGWIDRVVARDRHGRAKAVCWLSDTELSVSRCIETCASTITDVYSGDVRTVEFGAYILEAYLAWRDSYIVARRMAPSAVGQRRFRSYTGESVVLSRPT